MLTKEAENIAKSIPSFLNLCGEVMNPLAVRELSSSSDAMEIASKCIWVIAPFHFLVLMAIAPQGGGVGDGAPDYHVAARFLVALTGIIVIFMIGSFLALVPFGEKTYKNRANLWTSSILVGWFFSVLMGAGVIGWNYLTGGYHFDSVHKIFADDHHVGWLTAAIVCCGIGSLLALAISYLNYNRLRSAVGANGKVLVTFHGLRSIRYFVFFVVVFLTTASLFFGLGLLTTVPFFG